MLLVFHLIIAVCAAIGLGICLHIIWSKQNGKALVCPTNSNCEVVIHSVYASWRGIPWERIGAVYYGLLLLAYLLIIIVPALATTAMLVVIALPTIAAASVSLYLTYVQARILHEWCAVCILSALLCFSILLSSLAMWLN